jgi:hypothetical protein
VWFLEGALVRKREDRARLVGAREVYLDIYGSYLKGRSAIAGANSSAEIEIALVTSRRRSGKIRRLRRLTWVWHPRTISWAWSLLERYRPVAHEKSGSAPHEKLWNWIRIFRMHVHNWHSYTYCVPRIWCWLCCRGVWVRRWHRPGAPWSLIPLGETDDFGWVLFHARRYDEAIRELRSVVAVHPNDVYAGLSSKWVPGPKLVTRRNLPGEFYVGGRVDTHG